MKEKIIIADFSFEYVQTESAMTSLKGQKGKLFNSKFCTQQKQSFKNEGKLLFQSNTVSITETERMHCHQTFITRNTKGVLQAEGM